MEESDRQEKQGASLQYPTIATPILTTPTHTDEELLKEQGQRESRPAYRKMMVQCVAMGMVTMTTFLGIPPVPTLLEYEGRDSSGS